ncbi:peptidylprolyl isomerase [Spongiivirga citrea]|uniref:Peptidylprolyl isomerase n=1 Tax=Spongiivirga citrea TaxID=1481457 RepID=A0A6M0CK22_9FLAO|nr:peptidylprolyl isomerase [Spongiivirga citrea]NER16334.1 peptidylprolyl isomerase [Spongiivirga citrea]
MMKKSVFALAVLLTVQVAKAQDDADVAVANDTVMAPAVEKDTVKAPFKRVKLDGVASVVGDYVILDSDIDKTIFDLARQGIDTRKLTRCELLGKLMEDKLYAHHAVQDSVVVSDAEINDYVDRVIQYFVQEKGSLEKVLKFYRKDNEASFRKQLFDINKEQKLAQKMRETITDEVEITPEEVRTFFKGIPDDEKPKFGAELEIAQIVIEPVIPKDVEDETVERLKRMRKEIIEDGVPFRTQAILYSQDPGSSSKGGYYPLTKQTNFAKELKDMAFSLEVGQVSEPFKTDFGWHIVTVDKIRGEELDIRHLLLIPEAPKAEVLKAKERMDSIRLAIAKNEITFSDAALRFSEEKETRQNGGKLINPATFDTKFELTKMEPTLYQQIQNLADGELSLPLIDQSQPGKKKFKILKITNRISAHEADYSKDYIKIKELALKQKQLDVIRKWTREKIIDTYINLSNDYSGCNFANNWLKK